MSSSTSLYAEAQQYIPGGVNSPVRAFKSVNSAPIFMERGDGAYLFDSDGKRYIDYVCSWGPLILGHNHPSIKQALTEQLDRGITFGTATALETTLAKTITQLMPSIEQVRFVNSGTEATMSAIRLARAYTERDKFIKFEGCYHGHADCLLVNAGSGALTYGVPSSPGVPADTSKHTLTAKYNNLDSVRALFEAPDNRDEISAIIVEPVAGNMNCVLPEPGFLNGLRELCDQYGALLIFDEVMTGFRVALGGAQAHYQITPDLTTLGKVIGGGMPVGAFGGRKDIMSLLAPVGPVYQAGTLSGNPMAVSAGIATLNAIQADGFYDHLNEQAASLCFGLEEVASSAHISLKTTQVGGMFGIFMDVEKFPTFHHHMLDAGIYLAPSAFEAGFVSSCHNKQTLEATLSAAAAAFNAL